MTVDKQTKHGGISIAEFFSKDTSVSRIAKKCKNKKDLMDSQSIKSTIVKDESIKTCLTMRNEANLGQELEANHPENNSIEEFKLNLSQQLQKLLNLELTTLEQGWFHKLSSEFKKPYFIKLKRFIESEVKTHTVFPPSSDIYSWSRLTPFESVRVVIVGQDPYHNFNQAHGLAFSVKAPTPAPPSLKNMYKEIKEHNYPDFLVDNKIGDLTPWAVQGVLLLNTCLTVRAHNANSHSKQGWEQFTKRVLEVLIDDRIKSGSPLVFVLWGANAGRLIESILGPYPRSSTKYENIKVFQSVHPSPLSCHRGFFGSKHFKAVNEWLYERGSSMIDWSVSPTNKLSEVIERNELLAKNSHTV